MLHDTPLRPFVPGEYRVKLAAARWELAAYRRLRHEIFCVEQAIFPESDTDLVDRDATPIVAVSCIAGEADQVVGMVRIHEAGPGLWWGSRLGVHKDFRRVARLGAELIRLAVCTAHGRGCETFLAHVQAQNVPMFRGLHWHSQGEIELHGRAHHLMRADLDHYPPHGMASLSMLRPLDGACARAA